MQGWDYLWMPLFLIVCLLLIIVVLLQKGRGGGLSGAFGGAGGSGAFGTRTGDVFTWVTIILTGAFLLLAVVATVVARPELGPIHAPVLDPPSWPEGRDAEKVDVTMRCNTKGAIVRYTINGGEPTEKSLPYKSSVIVNKGQTVRAKAFRVGMEPSETITVTYAPKTPASAPAPIPAVAPTAPAK
jgi:protein translocase SecG subunit